MVLVSDVIAIPDNSLDNPISLVGEKANTRSILANLRLPVPPAFVVTSAAFYRFLNYQNGLNKWRAILDNAQVLSPEVMVETSRNLKKLVDGHSFDPDLVNIIHQHYRKQLKNQWAHLTISPTAATKAPVNIPLPIIKGETALIDFLRQIWSAQLTPHALSLQLLTKNPLIEQTPIMVSAHEKAIISGTITTIEPLTRNKNAMVIKAIYGTNPQTDHQIIPSDVYVVDRQSKNILSRELNAQKTAITANYFGHYKPTKIPPKNQFKPKLDQDQINFLVTSAQKIHSHQMAPQIINWLITKSGIYFTRFHPYNLDIKPPRQASIQSRPLATNLTILAKGLIAAPGITTGPIIRPSQTTGSIDGKVVVINQTDPNLLKRIRQAAGIIIETGGITSDIAAVARDIGIPTLIGTGKILEENGTVVLLDAIRGFVAINKTLPQPILLSPQKSTTSVNSKVSSVIATNIYLTINQLSDNQRDIYHQAYGVGELKGNDIVTSMGIHPKRLINRHLPAFKDTFIQKLTVVANRFGDRPVFYHPIDFPTTKAKNLEHGSVYEPAIESNSYFGFRGAFRSIADPLVFKQEMDLVSTLRHKHQLKNLSLCLPLVRSLTEFSSIKRMVSAANLYRSPSFKLAVKIGTPSAIDFIPKIAEQGVDYIFIDLDLLAITTQGYDPDSDEVDQEINLTHPILLQLLSQIVQVSDSVRLPCLAISYQLDQTATVVSNIIDSGVKGICISPPRYHQVKDWLKQAESKLLTSRQP